jgi:2-iminobutanoate/2-iminopropanoate deaminase
MKIVPLHHIPLRPEYNSTFSSAYIVEGGRLLFFSGCGPIPLYHKHPHDPVAEARWLAGDIREQTIHTFDAIGAVLKAAGGDFSNILKLNIYLTDISEQNVFNEISATIFDRKKPPARTLIEVPALAHPKMRLEVEGVAAVPIRRSRRAKTRR